VSTAARPVPAPSGPTIPFWQAAEQGILQIQSCADCSTVQFYPRLNCTSCGSRELSLVEASGRGQVYSFAIAHRSPHPAFDDQLPLVIALVELAEGPRMTSNIRGCEHADVYIGMPVEVVFERVADGIFLPLFRVAGL
jgi:uncharacterized protein